MSVRNGGTPRAFPPLPSLSDIDLRLLRVFHAIVRNGGFSAAQYELNMSQPAISAQMKQLEDRFGMRLCERGRSGFRLTNGGQVVYDALQKLFRAAEDFRQEVDSYKGELSGDLYVALDDATATNVASPLRDAIKIMDRDEPNVRLHIDIAPPAELEQGVIEERFHLAIGPFHHVAGSLVLEPLYSEKQTLYCGAGHPLFGVEDSDLTPKDLALHPYAARTYMDAGTLSGSAAFRRRAFASNMEALALLILTGGYIGYLPHHFAMPWVDRGEMWPLGESRLSYDSTFSMVTSKGLDFLAASYFLDQLRDVARRQGGRRKSAAASRKTVRQAS